MLTALHAVDQLEGIDRDVWEVNVDRSYHEEFETGKDQAQVAAQ